MLCVDPSWAVGRAQGYWWTFSSITFCGVIERDERARLLEPQSIVEGSQ